MSTEHDAEEAEEIAMQPLQALPGEAHDTSFLRPRYALGARMCGRQVVEFMNETVVVYPVAHHLCFFHTESRMMEFLQPTYTVQSIQSFHISTNRELIAVAEVHHSNAATSTPMKAASVIAAGSHVRDSHQQHFLSIYRTSTRARLKMIALPHNSSVVSCCFSSDNKFLAMLEDAPTHNVTYWKVSTGKMITSCKCPSRGSRICINPNNPNYISVSGPMILKYWLWTNNDFKIGNFLPQAREQEHFVDHLWLKEYMIAVSERGMLLCFRSTTDYNGVDLAHASRCHQPSYVRLECLAGHSKGFVLGGSAGFFSLYESSDDPKDPFAFVRTVSVGDVAFECVTVSPNLDSIVVCTKSSELLSLSMSTIETVQEDRVDYRDLLRYGNQARSVLQIDICLLRPIVATIGVDKTVRIWNFELRQYEVMHQCVDEPTALSLHPSGFQIIVAFKERIRLFHILQDSLRQVRELPIKSCRAIRFSSGGHLFACAAGLTVSIFRTYTCEAIYTFSGHIGAVKALTWTKSDFFLLSAAQDGSIYRWDLSKGTRCEDVQHLAKQCQYVAIISDDRDPKLAYATGTDGKIRELCGGEEARAVDLPVGVFATAIALTKDGRHLLAGTNAGTIMILSLPLSTKSYVQEYSTHAESITYMRMTDDGDHLLTSSDDGCVLVFKVVNHSTDLVQVPQEQDDFGDMGDNVKGSEKKKRVLPYVDAVLVAREDVEEQKAALVEMQQRYDQMKADVEFTMHRKENEWIDRLRVLKEESENLMIQERMRYEELERRHQQSQRKHTEDVAHKEATHVKMTQELENQYERKLAQEMSRYDALSETLEQTRQRCEALIEAQDTQNRNALHAERKTAYNRSKEQNDIIKRLHEDLRYNHVKFEEVLHQEEVDYQQEIYRLRADYEKQLDLERQNTAVKQGLLSATNTKLESLKKKMQELKASSHARDILLATERAKISKLESMLAQYEKHFEVCKFSITDKDKEIQGLKSSNRVLENFRSVLHHRIDNLEAAKAPMQDHMTHLETHLHDMQNELADEYQAKAVIQQDIESKETKIKMLQHEVKMLRQNMLKKEYSMSEMVREFTRMAQMRNIKDIEAAIKDAYKTFVIGEAVQKKPPKPVLSFAGSVDPPGSSPGKVKTVGVSSPQRKVSTPARDPKSKISLSPSTKIEDDSNQSQRITDEALGYDCKQAVDESVQQMEYMSKTIMTLRAALENAKAKADRVRRDAVAEGSMLIEECNKLRKENKIHMMKIRELEHQLYTLRENSSISSPAKTSGPILRSSVSSPQLPAVSQVNQELLLDASPLKYAGSGSGIPPNLSRRESPVSSPARTPKRDCSLPFAKLEHEKQLRHGSVAKIEELNSIVVQQRKEIQRLQMQVQILMSDENEQGDPVSRPGMIPDEIRVPPKSARVGPLRPIAPSTTSQPLKSSFVLKPLDSSPT